MTMWLFSKVVHVLSYERKNVGERWREERERERESFATDEYNK
jgi:hypothetical protein